MDNTSKKLFKKSFVGGFKKEDVANYIAEAATEHAREMDAVMSDMKALEAKNADIISANVKSEATPRSLRLNSSSIAPEHPLVRRMVELGRTPFGSPTLSNQALISGVPCLKLGPGESSRSHTANEFIKISEIREGIELYIKLLDGIEL